MTTDENTPLNLDPVLIPGMIIPVQTDGAVGGVNYNLLHVNEGGLLVQVQPYLNMESGDWVEVFWGDPSEPVAGELVLPEHVGEKFGLFIPSDRIAEGISDVWARVTRSGGGNGGESVPIGILVRSVFPGGTDPAPDLPGHQNLPAPEPELPPGGIIDEEAAKNGVKVTISSYPNMRVFDRITFSWGGELLQHDVTQAEVDAGSLEILVTEETILAAGDSNELALVYRVRDEVHNVSSDWSLRTIIQVEVGKGLFDAPIIENPDPTADPYDVIDLDVLGDNDLLVEVQAPINGLLQVDDVVALTWIGTTAQGEPVPVELPEQTVVRIPVTLKFYIPNADVIRLGRGRCVASYAVTRDGSSAGPSKRTFATFLGEEQRLPKPIVSDAVDGVLDPGLDGTTVVVPGDALEAGNYVRLVWLGTRANGSPLLHEEQRPVSGNEAGKPMTFSIPATAIAPLDGGTLSVYYSVEKSLDLKLESEREHLTVGEARDQLPPPFTRPAAEDGVLDPEDLPAYLQIVIPPWPGMHDDQTVHVFWRASVGLDYYDFIPISAPLVGQEVVFHLDRTHVEANLGAEVEISYRVETPGEVDQVSEPAIFIIDTQEETDEGPLRIMGARFNPNTWRGPTMPRILSALHDQSLTPMRVAWRYEDSERWTVASEWFDDKPGLKLYARSSSETWECRALNIVGNGAHINGVDEAAFVAMRDEVMDGAEVVVDMVAWGDPDYGGKLDPALIALENVVEISSSGYAFAARLRTGDLACWGNPDFGGMPAMNHGDFVQVRGSLWGFTARKRNGDLLAWGKSPIVPVPEEALQHKDYVDLQSTPHAIAALRQSGHVVAWGDPNNGGQLRQGQERFDDIVQVMGNLGAFAALRDLGDGGSVIGWGNGLYGGLVPEEIARLTNVRRLAATTGATFCILLESGEMKAWPPNQVGGDIPEDIARLTNAVEVSSTSLAFCARLRTGQVVAWGHEPTGGKLSTEAAGKSNIVQVTGNFGAFAALCSDGTVVTWGRDDCGGNSSAVSDRLTDVRAIYANACAFAALTADGRVVTWGTPGGGGNSSPVQPELTGHVTARRLLSPGETEALAASARALRRRRR
ncbi:RCC1 domain-containing protein [Pseudomonas japonica]|uniref:Alpha-tubulin suppressor n=1 Tax=Pseudomonas japonica TaxID=256466 RepID=A0A239G1Y2_9PSED|nr:hypothetical protein [Pseudomonas japonica]SNS63169.1 hypothetical protein SAMN05444352_111112 [Pseudomonas japonica]